MGELPTRGERSPEEQFADSQAVQAYFRNPGEQQSIRYIPEGGEWKPVIPGDSDYKRALPVRFDKETGMPISPWDPAYESAAKKRQKQFR